MCCVKFRGKDGLQPNVDKVGSYIDDVLYCSAGLYLRYGEEND